VPVFSEVASLTAPETRFEGVFGVTVTPFGPGGASVDEEGVGRVCGAMLAEGVRHLVPCGNTGEFYALSPAERRRVVELTIKAGAGRASVIVGVGGALEDAVGLARYAETAGADALMVHHPVHPYVTEEGYLAYVRSIAASTALPIVPYLRLPVLGDEGIRRLIDIEKVVAIKYAWNDLLAFGSAVASSSGRRQIAWICGTAESWAPFYWAAGAVGFTSGLANVTAVHSLALLAALESGDRAAVMAIWRLIRPFEELRSRGADGYNVAVVKEALRLVGRPAGPVRPPASDVGPADSAAIAQLLERWKAAEPLAALTR
jgi:4-hydroxy-tetrahydrodipicolinate synthase